MFIETSNGLALGRGTPIVYAFSSLQTLVNCYPFNVVLRTRRVTTSEANLLSSHGFTSTQVGEIKLWQKD